MRLAVQLYTLRERMAQDVEGTLHALASIGVEHVELAGLYGHSAAEFRGLLDAAGLTAPSAHVPLGQTLDAATLGVETIVVPSVPEDVDVELLRGFVYHNHDFEFRSDLWDRIVALGLDHELDVGWVHAAGRDPVALLRELHGRVPFVHAKDMRNGRDVPVGDGELDWPAITAAAREAGTQWLVIELDNPSADPIEDVRRSLKTLA